MKRAQAEPDRATEFALKMKALNSEFASWVEAQQSARPNVCWDADARQYLAYVAQLKEEYADVVSAPAEPVEKAPRTLAVAAPAPAASAPPLAAPPAPFAPPPPAAPFFAAFGAGASAGAFAFPPAPAMTFGGGGASPFSSLQPAAAAAEAEEDEPERPLSPSVHKSSAEDDGETVLFESKCKLFFRGGGDGQDNTWAVRGMGNLQLRCPLDAGAAGSARLILRNDTGKAMLNAKLYAGMKVVVKEGKSVCTTVFNTVAPSVAVAGDAEPAAPAEAPSKAVMTMLRFKTGEEADRLKQAMEGCLAK